MVLLSIVDGLDRTISLAAVRYDISNDRKSSRVHKGNNSEHHNEKDRDHDRAGGGCQQHTFMSASIYSILLHSTPLSSAFLTVQHQVNDYTYTYNNQLTTTTTTMTTTTVTTFMAGTKSICKTILHAFSVQRMLCADPGRRSGKTHQHPRLD